MMRWLRSLVAASQVTVETASDLALETKEDLRDSTVAVVKLPSSRALEDAMGTHKKKDFIRWMYATPREEWALEGCSKTFYGHLLKPGGKQKFRSCERAEIAMHALQQNVQPNRREMSALIALLLGEEDVKYSWPFERLLRMGAHPCMKINKKPWIDAALLEGRFALALLLLDLGAKTTDRQGAVRHELLHLVFDKQSRNDHYALLKYHTDYFDSMYDGMESRRESGASVPVLSDDGFRLNSKKEELILALLDRGVDINHVLADGRTAYAMASGQMRAFLEERGALPKGRGAYGVDIANQLLMVGDWKGLEKVLALEPRALLATNENGTLAVGAWWQLNPGLATAALGWFKEHGLWNDILAAHDRHGRNFLTAGLAALIKNGPEKDKEQALADQLEWHLGRLETEIHSSMWVDPDNNGETINFWLGVARNESLMAKYVLPRRELMLKAALAHVDQRLEEQPSNESRRARL